MFSFHLQPLLSLMESSSGLIESGNTWTINSAFAVANATRRLQTEHPQTLDIDIPGDVPTPTTLMQLLQVVQQRFTGNLKLQLWGSYFKYEDCSEMIKTLAKSR